MFCLRYNEVMKSKGNRKLYTTGQLARTAGVTERTLRFYDKKGLLHPSEIEENGYRKYTDEDLITLQRILMFKSLGFSLDEISVLLLDSRKDIVQSLRTQKELLQDKIARMKSLSDTLDLAIRQFESRDNTNQTVLKLIQTIQKEEQLSEQYKNSANLRIRNELHRKYSQADIPWFDWLYSQMDFSGVTRFLELGCGGGNLWEHASISLRNRDIFLTDLSEGMLEDARKRLGNEEFTYLQVNAESIPFKDRYFDAAAAHHVLFYLQDLEQGLSEIFRVLRKGGTFYASAYGENHMKEITDLVQEFDPEIYLSSEKLNRKFGKENGGKILSRYASDVRYIPYEDSLLVTEAMDLADYVLSCHGNQVERLQGRYEEFLDFLQKKIDAEGGIRITKDAGLFIAKK